MHQILKTMATFANSGQICDGLGMIFPFLLKIFPGTTRFTPLRKYLSNGGKITKLAKLKFSNVFLFFLLHILIFGKCCFKFQEIIGEHRQEGEYMNNRNSFL